MTHHLSRRALLAGAMSALTTACMANPPETSRRPLPRQSLANSPRPSATRPNARPGLDTIIEDAGLTGLVSVAVMDLGTGLVIEDHAPNQRMLPASVTKSITALYALDALGAEYRFTTRLIATGPVVDGVLQGDLILAGGGDPTLATDDLAQMAADLKSAGVSSVTGRFLVYGNALPYEEEIDPAQLDHLGYNPAISGLNLNFNRVHFEWARAGGSYQVSMDARSDRYRPDVTMSVMRIADRNLPVYAYADGGTRDEWSVARAALGSGGSRWLPVRKPALYAGDVFRVFARGQGVTLPAAERVRDLPEGRAIVTHQSESLTEILRGMLRFSTNLTAEVVGLSATTAREGQPPANLGASARQMSRWVNRSFGTMATFEDHSGLGDETRITAEDLLRIHSHPGIHGRLEPILKNIALKDSNGNAINNSGITVRAKTGTLNFVSTLSGYIRSADGRDLAFAILCGDIPRRNAAKESQDEQPHGSITYNTRAKALQQRLLQRWG